MRRGCRRRVKRRAGSEVFAPPRTRALLRGTPRGRLQRRAVKKTKLSTAAKRACVHRGERSPWPITSRSARQACSPAQRYCTLTRAQLSRQAVLAPVLYIRSRLKSWVLLKRLLIPWSASMEQRDAIIGRAVGLHRRSSASTQVRSRLGARRGGERAPEKGGVTPGSGSRSRSCPPQQKVRVVHRPSALSSTCLPHSPTRFGVRVRASRRRAGRDWWDGRRGTGAADSAATIAVAGVPRPAGRRPPLRPTPA